MTAILSSLRSCGPESRIMVSKCIVVVGGIVGLPNMSSRLQEELLHLGEVARTSLAAGVGSVASRQDAEALLSLSNCCLVQLPCVPSFVAWMGGSVIGSVDGLRSVSLSRGSWEEQGCRVLDESAVTDMEGAALEEGALEERELMEKEREMFVKTSGMVRRAEGE